MTYDLVIRGGTVIDGSGLPRYRADVGVAGGRIARIGTIRDGGREEIDARDRVVAPGFIDGHTHMDAQVAWDPLGTCSCWHGVTTVVMGNCGFTLAPCRTGEEHLVVRNLERAEDISPEAMQAGIEWTWETYARVSRRGGALAQGHQLRRLRRALGPAHLRHGRARLLRAGHRRGPRGDEAGAGGRARRRGHGLHDLAHAQPRDGGPPAGGQSRGRRGTRCRRWCG